MPAKTLKCKNHSKCKAMIYTANTTGLCRPCLDGQTRQASFDRAAKANAAKPSVQVAQDRTKALREQELTVLRKKYDESLRIIEQKDREIQALDNLVTKGIETHTIEPQHGSGTSEATAVVVLSDWHYEERVNLETVSGLNQHNLEISAKRADRAFAGAHRLIQLLQQDVKIENAVVALLGDFISNDIHEEFPENNELPPMLALEAVQNKLASGIQFLLDNTKLNLTFPCHSGNHARTTRTTRFSGENGHSLEYLMYRHLAGHFRHDQRVNFIIPEGPHSYVNVYNMILRFHHGHMIKYQGGIGGIFIPTYKAIAQWNKARKADLDVFGHFHQCKDGGNFICNGSNIGYNGFALSIKADFEPPKQQLFLIDKKRGRTCTWPLLTGGTK